MAGWTVQIDPPAVASGRTMLDLSSGPIQVGSLDGSSGIDWGTAQIVEYSTQQGQYGNSVADFVLPNRTITLSLILGGTGYEQQEQTARTQLAQKVALLQREGGQLLRQRQGGAAMYADIVDAQLTIPDQYGETGDVEPNVQLVLTCLPDFYGDEITLDTVHATGFCTGVLTQNGSQAVIEGDYPARARIVVTDTSGNTQNGMVWGVRSRTYDSASTAALVYPATSLTPLSGATSSSGIVDLAFPSGTAGSWVPMLATNTSGTALTHWGSYAVWARVNLNSFTTAQMRLVWGSGGLANPSTNDPVALPSYSGWCLVNLGSIRIDKPLVGANQWTGVIQVNPQAASGDMQISYVYLQPLDDAAGTAIASSGQNSSSIANTGSPAAGVDSSANGGTLTWTNPAPNNWPASVSTTNTGSGGGLSLSHLLEVTQLGFGVSSSATINGIEVSVDGYISANAYTPNAQVSLLNAGAVTGSSRTSGTQWTAAKQTFTFGSPTDLWGTTWTPAQINATNFGTAFSLNTESLDGNAAYSYVSSITVTVYYSFPSGFTTTQDVVIAANGVAELRFDGPIRQDPAGGPYGPMALVAGDLPRIPASGVENRPAQVFCKPSRGYLGTSVADSALDGMKVQVIYRPCWLSRP